MDKEVAEYVNVLLANRQYLLEERENASDYNKDKELQEMTESEQSLIYKAQKAMDYIIEESYREYWLPVSIRVSLEMPLQPKAMMLGLAIF